MTSCLAAGPTSESGERFSPMTTDEELAPLVDSDAGHAPVRRQRRSPSSDSAPFEECEGGQSEVRHRLSVGSVSRRGGLGLGGDQCEEGDYNAAEDWGYTSRGGSSPSNVGAASSAGNDADAARGDESLHKFWHRAGWLVLLLMCQSTSSLILEHFEALIRTHPVVIYFLTMLVGAGGNAGGQSTVLVVRRLALAVVKGGKNRDEISVKRIVSEEASVGARLALVLFFACILRCIVFQVRGVECLAICLSMLCIVFTSTLVGAALPLLLRKLRLDPAHAGATIQVVMDVSGVSLTCVVSCLVLGVPLSSTPAPAAGANTTATTTLLAAVAVDPGILYGSMHRLAAFGGHLDTSAVTAVQVDTAAPMTIN